MKQLKPREVADHRASLLAQQNGFCALCHEPIEPGKAVLDHDHKTGLVRGVLHRGCNALEGVITNNCARNLVSPERLAAIFQTWSKYHDQSGTVLHPTHRTPEQKAVRTRKRAALARKRKKQ
jgi:hypothetical protein